MIDSVKNIKNEQRNLIIGFWVVILFLLVLFWLGFTNFYNNRISEIQKSQKTFIETILASQSNGIGLEIFLGQITAYKPRTEEISRQISGVAPNHIICIYNNSGEQIFPELMSCDSQIQNYSQSLNYPVVEGDSRIGDVRVMYGDNTSFFTTLSNYKTEIFISIFSFLLVVVMMTYFMRIYLKRMFIRISEAEKNRLAAQVAEELAHDLESPIETAKSIIESDKNMIDQERQLAYGAISSALDIVKQLKLGPQSLQCEESSEKFLLISVIEDICSEKRREFSSFSDVNIEVIPDQSLYGTFIKVNYFKLKRALSNIINNSQKYRNGAVAIKVKLSCDLNFIKILIEDNGAGIPEEILEELGEREVTSDKEAGKGLGLYNAKNIIEGFGGKIELNSKVGEGTNVLISLPIDEPPSWYISEINLKSTFTVVILDDDIIARKNWIRRLSSISNKIKVLTYATYKEFKNENSKIPDDSLFIVDYELRNDQITGIEVIKRHGLVKKSILVTSKYNYEEVYKACNEFGISMIPKRVAQFVPVKIQNESSALDGVLIDDDKYVRAMWKDSSLSFKKNFLVLSNMSEFWTNSLSIPKTTPIYVDSKLGNGIRGEDAAVKMHEEGFKNIYLSTGYRASKFEKMDWIKGVIGKEPPWKDAQIG